MAIVRTTRKDTNTTGTTGTPPPAVAKTKSVVKPAGSAAARATVRGDGRAVQNRAPVSAKSGDAGRFISETMTELRRVVWPTREQVRAGTVVTVGLLIFFALYIYALDFIAGWLTTTLGFYSSPISK